MKHIFKTYWPHALLVILVGIIAFINRQPNTLLIGWDNLLPELNFKLNIQRSLFAVWQEYQGLGLLGGMGHASDLIRQLILLCLSVIFPINLLRYAWTMSMLLVGGLGAYTLILYLLKITFSPSP